MLRIVVSVFLAVATSAWAEPVPDASLHAVADRPVRLELDDGRTVDGRLLAFDAASVTVVATGTQGRAGVRHNLLHLCG